MLVKSVHASAQMLQWLPISELNTTILLWPICLQVTCPSPISCSCLTTFSYAPARLASFLTIKQPQQAAHLGSLPFLVSLPDALHPDGHIFFFLTVFRSLLKYHLVRENFPNHLYERAQAFPSPCIIFPLAFVTPGTVYMICLLIVYLLQ